MIWLAELRFVANAESSHSLHKKKSEPITVDRVIRWQPEIVTILPADVANSWEVEMSTSYPVVLIGGQLQDARALNDCSSRIGIKCTR